MKKLLVVLWVLRTMSFSVQAQTIDDYFMEAAHNNPGLKARYKVFEAALQKSAQVSSLGDLQFSFGYFVSPVETRVGPQRARFSLTQMFPWFGTLKSQGEASSYAAEAQYQAFLNARNKLYYEVAAVYYPLYELHQLIAVEAQNQALLETYKRITTSKVTSGEGTMVDVIRVDMQLKASVTRGAILQQKKKPLETRMNKLMGRKEYAPIEVLDSLGVGNFPQSMSVDSVLNAHPLLAQIDQQLNASVAQEQAAVKQGYPKIGLGLDYVLVDERTDMAVPQNGQDVWMPMVSVSIPLYRAKYSGAQQEARLMQESYALQREEMENQLVMQYEMVRFEAQEQFALIQLYEAQIKEAQQSLRLLFTAYSNSGKNFEEVLRMQQQVLQFENQYYTALSQYYVVLAKLDYLTAKNRKL